MDKKRRILFWPTDGLRPSLAASMNALCSNAAKFGHECSLLIVGGEGGSDGLEPMLARIAAGFGFPARFAGIALRKALIARLSERFDREILESGLLPSSHSVIWPGPGANRNIALLAAAGSLFITTDDDVIAAPAGRNNGSRNPRPAFSRSFIPFETSYESSRTHALESVQEEEIDILASHFNILGKTASEAGLSKDAGRNAEGRIMLSAAGMYGDSGTRGTTGFLSIEGGARERAYENYETLRYSREVIRIPESLTLGRTTYLMTMHAGFDNTRVIPPFFTLGRNTDGLFSIVMRLVYPPEVRAFQPFGLLHDPRPIREANRRSLVAYELSPADLLIPIAASLAPPLDVTDPSHRMRILGENLVSISAMRESDFAELAAMHFLGPVMEYIDRIRALLEKHGHRPEAWARDAMEHVEEVLTYVHDPRRLFGDSGCGLSVGGLEDMTGSYGKLLIVWPELWEEAMGLFDRITG